MVKGTQGKGSLSRGRSGDDGLGSDWEADWGQEYLWAWGGLLRSRCPCGGVRVCRQGVAGTG